MVRVFQSPEEFRSRPMYRRDIITRGIRPSRIIGSYRFQDPVDCGVKDCGQIHTHGYVVLNTDGTETNTGWDCGLDHYGVEFFEMRKVYDRAEREHPHRQALHDTAASAENLRQRLRTFQEQPHGGKWLHQNLRSFAKLYPRPLLEIARRHAERGEVMVTVNQSRALVRGLKAFTLDTENWPLVELELELDRFLDLDPDNMPFNEVRRWCEWASTFESRIANCENLLEEGRKFFRRSNLALLQYLVSEKETQEQLSWMVWSNASGEQPSTPPQKEKAWQRMLKRLSPTNS
jgi:hypothetical protein